MPKFYARLENDAGDFREIVLWAASENEARAIVRRREFKLAAHRLPAEKVAEIEAGIEAGTASKDDIVSLQIHNQSEPYEVVYLSDKPAGRKGDKPSPPAEEESE